MIAIPAWIVQLGLFALVAALLWASLRRVPQGFECVVERGGRYRATLRAGTHFIVPLLDRSRDLMDIREMPLATRKLTVVTRDEIEVSIALSCFVQITDAARASYEVRDVHAAVQELVTTQVANHLAACPLGQLVADRERALRELPEKLDRATDVWGIKVTRLDIKDVQPPAPLLQAILDETRAEHEQRAHILQADGARALALEAARRDAELALAAEAHASALARARFEAAESTAAAERATAERLARDADELALAQLVAERNASDRAVERARVAAAEAQAQATLEAQAQTAESASAWRAALDAAQRQREATAQEQRLQAQAAAHAAELARIADARAVEAQQHARAEAEAEAEGQRRAAHAEIQHALQFAAAEHTAEQQRRQLQFDTEQRAIEQGRQLEAARHAAQQAGAELELAARVRSAELISAEAAHLARARELAAEADARAVQLLSAALHGVNAHTLSYLAAREQADALRSLGTGSLSGAAAGAAAALVAQSAVPIGMQQPVASVPLVQATPVGPDDAGYLAARASASGVGSLREGDVSARSA